MAFDQQDYRCENCDCDYRRVDARTWYCPWCDATMIEHEVMREVTWNPPADSEHEGAA